jgi:hypothetical protein
MEIQRGDIMLVSRKFGVTRQYVRLLIIGERTPQKGKGNQILKTLNQLSQSREQIITANLANN